MVTAEEKALQDKSDMLDDVRMQKIFFVDYYFNVLNRSINCWI